MSQQKDHGSLEIDGELFLKNHSIQEVSDYLLGLMEDPSDNSFRQLGTLFIEDPKFRTDIPVLISRAFIAKGLKGVRLLKEAVLTPDDKIVALTAFGCLRYASKGQWIPFLHTDFNVPTQLEQPLSAEVVVAASQAISEIIEASQARPDLFIKLIGFLLFGSQHLLLQEGDNEKDLYDFLRLTVFEIFTEPVIKITRKLISDFAALVDEEASEESYQRFLSQHPVFIDPLAAQVIAKSKLGSELITDFVIKRLDDDYLLVEIEKPQDPIFTKKNDFSSEFIHAFGQVLDFQEWVEANIAYANKNLPRISAPKGILIIGRNNSLSEFQKAKLKRFCVNSRAIEIFTYDDLLNRAQNLYNNLHRNLSQDE